MSDAVIKMKCMVCGNVEEAKASEITKSKNGKPAEPPVCSKCMGPLIAKGARLI